MSGLNEMRSRTLDGAEYIRKEDVVRYLRDTTRDWLASSHTEATRVTAACVNQIADQIEKVGP